MSARKVIKVGDSSKGHPIPPAPAPDAEATQILPGPETIIAGPETATRPGLPGRVPTQAASPPGPPAPPAPAGPPGPPGPPDGLVRYGPGVPAGPPGGDAAQAAGRVWRSGFPPAPARRRPRLRRLAGSALTVILLGAAGVVLFVRLHHPSFQVTGVTIAQHKRAGCRVDVTGRITTSGAAGTVTYQWVFTPARRPPHPRSQPVAAGQHAAYVTAIVQGRGHGSARQTVTLQVLGPSPRTATAGVTVHC